MQRTGSILVVDHEPTIIEILVELLTDEGYLAHAASDSAAALDIIARYPPALLMLDIRMSGLYGAELIAHIHETSPATIPIVLMATMLRDAEPLLVPGAIECLPKPFDIEDLLTCVARHVRPFQTKALIPA